MKIFGSWKELVQLVFRKDSNEVQLKPNQSITYTATRTVELPPQDANSILVGEGSTQTLTGKTIDGDDNTVQDLALASLKTDVGNANQFLRRDGSGIVVSTSKAVPSGDVVGTTDSQTLTNKTITILDALLTVQDNVDPTKQVRFEASGITAGNTRILTIPDANATLVGEDTTQTLSNKTLATPSITTRANFSNQAEASFVDSGSNFVRFKAPTTVSASYTMELPTAAGTTNQALSINGSGNLFWQTVSGASTATPTTQGQTTSYFPIVASAVNSVSSADYTVTTTDGYSTILMSTGATGRTVNLPAASSNTGRKLTIKKTDSGAGTVTIDANASETIDGRLTEILRSQYAVIEIVCDGTGWYIEDLLDSGTYTPSVQSSSNVSAITFHRATYSRTLRTVVVSGQFDVTSGSAGNSIITINPPFASNFTDTRDANGTVTIISDPITLLTFGVDSEDVNDVLRFNGQTVTASAAVVCDYICQYTIK